MTHEPLLSASAFVETFETILGFPIEESTPEEFQNLSDSECLDLAAQLDHTLQMERRTLRSHPSAVLPLPFQEVPLASAIAEWFADDEESNCQMLWMAAC